MVDQIEPHGLDEHPVQIDRVDGANAVHATASGQDADILGVADQIDAAQVEGLSDQLH